MSIRRLGWLCGVPFVCCFLCSVKAQTTPWTAVEVRGDGHGQLNRIAFANDEVGWICAGLNTILKTVDGGQSWKVLQTNLAVQGTEVTSIWFANEERGWAAGALRQQPAIWQTTDGGKRWVAQQLWPHAMSGLTGALLDVRFVDDRKGWAVGFNGDKAIIVASDDGGQHWKTQYSGGEITRQFSRVSCSNRRSAWVLSTDAVLQTEDGGESWQLRYFDSGLLNDVDAVKPSEAWVAGAWGHLLHTLNGIAWSEVAVGGPVRDHFFGYIRFTDANRGWVTGTKCDILGTTNGGKTWTPEQCPLAPELRAEVTTGAIVRTASKLFVIANPGYILVRSIK